MSSYMNFYLKHPKFTTYLPLGSYSRSTKIYEALRDCSPYEEVRPLTEKIMENASRHISDSVENLKEQTERYRKDTDLLLQANNNLAEKYEIIADIENSILECELDLKEYSEASAYLDFLTNILDDIRYSDDDGINPEEYIFFGIEANPDIEGD